MRKQFTRLLASLTSAVICIPLCTQMPVNAADTGSCGEDAYYSVSDGVLTVSGTGTIENAEALREAKAVVISEGITGFADPSESPWAENTVLERISFPEGFADLPAKCFLGSTALREVHLPDSMQSIGKYCFEGCTQLETVDLPGSLTALPAGCFYGCTQLNAPELPGTLTELGSSCFYSCTGLTVIALPDSLTVLGGSCFADCANLSSITLPDQIVTIGSGCFSGCTALTGIVLPPNIELIPNSCFEGCERLETVTMPEQCTIMLNRCFADCPALTELIFPENALPLSVFENAFSGSQQALQQDGDFILLANGKYLFRYVGEGKPAVTVPDTVQCIGNGAFGFFSIDTMQYVTHPEIEQITLPAGLTHISDSAFLNLSGLRELEIPESVISIGGTAFSGCTALAKVNLPENLEVLSIGAFIGCESLTEITVPAQITVLPDSCFSGCTSLKAVHLAANTTEIGSGCFAGCTALKSLSLPETVTTLGGSCFSGCSALTEINFPDSILHVGADVLADTALMEEKDGFTVFAGRFLTGYSGSDANIFIPEGVTVIADGTFRDDTMTGNRTTVTVTCPDSLRSIGAQAFQNNIKLTRVTLNDGLLYIGRNAFAKCESLTSLSVPESVGTIEAQDDHGAIAAVSGVLCSAAHAFALEYGLSFTETGTEMHGSGKNYTLDPETEGWFFGNSGTAFGSTYAFTEEGLAAARALAPASEIPSSTWSGSCFGLALTVLLAKAGVITPDMLQPGAKTLSEVQPTEEIISFINYYHCVQDSPAYLGSIRNDSTETAAQTFLRIVDLAAQVPYGTLPLMIDITTGRGGRHALLAYGVEAGEWVWDSVQYNSRIVIWDPNYPNKVNDASCIYYDRSSFDWCIPQYQTAYSFRTKEASGKLNAVSNDLSVLNALPYPSRAASLRGDTDCSGVVNIADAVLLARFCAEDALITVTAQGKQNSDLDGDAQVGAPDLAILLELLANLRD